MPDGRGINAFRHRFLERVVPDDDPKPVIDLPRYGTNKSWEWHGCLMVSVILLDATMKRHLRYEGDLDTVVNPKQIAQRFALQYGVNVDDMMQQYEFVRPILLTPGIEIPTTLESALVNLSMSGKTVDVKLKGFLQ